MTSAIRRRRAGALPSFALILGSVALSLPVGLTTAVAPAAAVGTGATVAPAAAVGTATAVDLTPVGPFPGTIIPGVRVGSIDLSGMDEATARQVLSQAFAGVGQGTITVTAGANSTTITYAQIDRRVDIDALVADAFAVGRDGTTFQRFFAMVRTMTSGHSLTPQVVLDEAVLTVLVNGAAAASGVKAVNARAIRTKTGFSTVAAKAGFRYDTSTALSALVAQLADLNSPPQLTSILQGAVSEPQITDAEAQAARAGAAAMSQPVVLANAGETWTIPENVVHSWISFKVVAGTIQIALSETLIAKSITKAAAQINRDPVSASWAFDPQGVTVVPGKNGREVDVPRTTRRVQVFLQGRAAGTVSFDKKLGPTVKLTEPELTTAEAQAQASNFTLLSTWTTYFQPAAHNGYGANIWVPAGYLDNIVVQPGATFSFWDAVGEVSFARGYRMGGAIIGGRTQEGVALAGGICSTSTTLFNAALRAGFEMGERSNHYYYITRYPVGLDATVSKTSGGGEQNVTWTNDTPYPVLIKSFKTGGSVTFSLYGIPNGRVVSFSKPIIKNYRKATQEEVLVSTLPAGKRVRIEYPDDGFDAWVTRTVRDEAGKVVHQETYYSHYAMVKGIVYVGDPAGKPLEVPSYAPGAQGG